MSAGVSTSKKIRESEISTSENAVRIRSQDICLAPTSPVVDITASKNRLPMITGCPLLPLQTGTQISFSEDRNRRMSRLISFVPTKG